MGELVLFRPSSSATSRRVAPRASQEAEIVFFTGVRYERAEPAPSIVEANQPPPEGGLNGTGGGKRKRRA